MKDFLLHQLRLKFSPYFIFLTTIILTLLLRTAESYAQTTCDLGTKLSDCAGPGCPALSTYPNATYAPAPPGGSDAAFSVLVGGNFTLSSQNIAAETEGRMAIKGNLILGNGSTPYNNYYGIGTSGGGTLVVSPANVSGLIIGGTIQGSTNSFGVGGTGVVMGGTYNNNLPNFIPVDDNNGNTPAGLGVDIDACLSEISAKSQYWATLTATGAASGSVLTGDGVSMVQVFNVAVWQPFSFSGIPAGASVIVNVSGATHTGVSMPPINAVPVNGAPSLFNLLFNFHQAANVTFSGSSNGFYGSAIIPNGNANLQIANFDGRLVVGGNLTHNASGGEIHNYPYTGELPCPPVCIKPAFPVIGNPTCAVDDQTYSVVFSITGKNGTVKVSAGTLSGTGSGPYTVSNIPTGTNLKITDSLSAACKFDTLIVSPVCDCVPDIPTILTPNVLVCQGDTFPTLKVAVTGQATVDWFDAATGGNLLATGTLSYKPSGTATVADTIYVQTRSTDPDCAGQISVTRTPVFINVQNCTVLVDLHLKKFIDNKVRQVGDTVTYTIKVWNESATPATGVEVTDSLNLGVTYLSSSATRGSYNAGAAKWIIGNIAANGDTVTLTIKVKVKSQGLWFNTAEICNANEKDVDSELCNSIPEEDDIDYQCFTVPFKLCPAEKVEISAPANYQGIVWFRTFNGTTTQAGTGAVILVQEPGSYTFTATNGNCPAEGCCPVIIEPGDNCCPVDICIPVTLRKLKK